MYDDAVSKLQQTGFVAVRGETHPHATAPASAVLAQSPRAASVEPHGTHVTLTISAGQRLAQLPPVVGLSQQQAQVAIENAGFTIGDVVTQPSDAPKGQVLSTDPSSGASIPLPARVSMIVSGGAATVVMPDVVGRELPSARASIEQLGLGMLPVIVDTVSASAPNTVVAQTPAAGRVVPANSKVRLTVAP
jgi:serine/threonine-protein kinase